jgi:hypothetical protein
VHLGEARGHIVLRTGQRHSCRWRRRTAQRSFIEWETLPITSPPHAGRGKVGSSINGRGGNQSVSVYEVQQCLFDYLRAMENAPADAPRPGLSVEGYDLIDEERNALVNRDIAAFHATGVHPVIINGMGVVMYDEHFRPRLKSSGSSGTG